MATKTGKIRAINDVGTLVQLYLETKDGLRVVSGDGNLTRRALHAAFGRDLLGKYIEYEVESWGGMSWFAPAGPEEVTSGNDTENNPRNRRRK